MTKSIQKFLAVTEYRRQKQIAYNQEHHITPRSVTRAVEDSLAVYQTDRDKAEMILREVSGNLDITQTLQDLQGEMLEAANNLEFEKAALLRDQIRELKRGLGGEPVPAGKSAHPSVTYKSPRRQKSRRA
jgi:excinuclease ABC subunit B